MGQTIEKSKIKDLQVQDFTDGLIAECYNPVAGRKFFYFPRHCKQATEIVIFQDIVARLDALTNEAKDLNNLQKISNHVDYLIGFEQRSQEKCLKRMSEDLIYKIFTLIARMFQKETTAEALSTLKTNIDVRIANLTT